MGDDGFTLKYNTHTQGYVPGIAKTVPGHIKKILAFTFIDRLCLCFFHQLDDRNLEMRYIHVIVFITFVLEKIGTSDRLCDTIPQIGSS